MHTFVNPLVRLGLTNTHAEDQYGYIRPQETELVASCSSHSCCQQLHGRTDYFNRHGVVKNAKRGQTFCTDCGSALFWSRRLILKPKRLVAL